MLGKLFGKKPDIKGARASSSVAPRSSVARITDA
jgi:hypothetical protein